MPVGATPRTTACWAPAGTPVGATPRTSACWAPAGTPVGAVPSIIGLAEGGSGAWTCTGASRSSGLPDGTGVTRMALAAGGWAGG
jgi:hypothetical protein